MVDKITNPFIYSTPDQIQDPQQAINLFVDVFKDFYMIENMGNTFIHGPRGSGKSMMFRMMKPDCQKLRLERKLFDLNYFAVYIPVKDTSLNIQELEFFKNNHGEKIFNEHLMATYFTIAVLKCLSEEEIEDKFNDVKAIELFYRSMVDLLLTCGYEYTATEIHFTTFTEVFEKLILIFEEILTAFSQYIQRLSLGMKNLSYSGPLCLYRNLLLPLIKSINGLSFLPKGKPLYILIDDADLLNYNQTQILNSWVSFRTTSIVCFKVTTQLNYKTYYTTNTATKIDSPHDYHEINLSEIYTSNESENYQKNVKDMVERRLKYISGIEVSAEDFFPKNEDQEAAVEALRKGQEKDYGYDYAYRNARLDYMLSLTNEYTYSYGGFNQLVHLSSGILRNFIDLSFKMFDKTLKKEGTVTHISSSVQDQEIRDYSIWVLNQLDKTIEDQGLDPIQVNKYRCLKSLINSAGKAFRMYLESGKSERRKFSFYFDGEVNDEAKKILKLGISEGLFHYASHGSKTGLGRSHKYVMNRILAPIFKLDPFSFSGYLNLPKEKVELAIFDEAGFILYIKGRIRANDTSEDQLKLDLN